ncbi:MAG: hypothetical protein ABUL50_11700, partial [Rhizobacter sp.]
RQLNELTVENSGMIKPDVLAKEAHRRLGLDWPQSGQIVDLPRWSRGKRRTRLPRERASSSSPASCSCCSR